MAKKTGSKKMPTIALIAHDGKKTELVLFVKENRSLLERYHLIATGNSGKLVVTTGLS